MKTNTTDKEDIEELFGYPPIYPNENKIKDDFNEGYKKALKDVKKLYDSHWKRLILTPEELDEALNDLEENGIQK